MRRAPHTSPHRVKAAGRANEFGWRVQPQPTLVLAVLNAKWQHREGPASIYLAQPTVSASHYPPASRLHSLPLPAYRFPVYLLNVYINVVLKSSKYQKRSNNPGVLLMLSLFVLQAHSLLQR